jgi:adenylate kinase family enzyme
MSETESEFGLNGEAATDEPTRAEAAETKPFPESEYRQVLKLSEELGFIVNERIKQIKYDARNILQQFPDPINMAEEVASIMTEYQLACEEVIIGFKEGTDEQTKALLGLQIDRIILLIEAHWDPDCINEELDWAINDATNRNRTKVVEILTDFRNKL